jgi:hypothetical protein
MIERVPVEKRQRKPVDDRVVASVLVGVMRVGDAVVVPNQRISNLMKCTARRAGVKVVSRGMLNGKLVVWRVE